MNAAAASALYEAERQGVKQIQGMLWDNAGGMCAAGVLCAAGISGLYLSPVDGCFLCGAKMQTLHAGARISDEHSLVVHLNNDHGLTFSEIARKLGPDSV